MGLMNNQINHFQTLHPEEEITQTTYGSSEGKFDSHFQSDIFWKVISPLAKESTY